MHLPACTMWRPLRAEGIREAIHSQLLDRASRSAVMVHHVPTLKMCDAYNVIPRRTKVTGLKDKQMDEQRV
jgi:hypothetical protein